MRAVILAGGEGTRLRPLSAGQPKPMVRLFDRPLLEHLLHLLRENGVTEICAALHFMPEAIASYFGDGSAFGVHLTWFVEPVPLGTAGSVKHCASFLGDEDFLVVSGDAVCDFDLRACMDFHRARCAEATLVLCPSAAPLEYGLVVTDREGRIRRFVEKPAWDQVVTDRVNTGIYLLSPGVLETIPEGEPRDFGRDIFPQLLREGRRLYGCEAEGYWCDVGDCGSYLACTADALDGRVRLETGVPERRPGVLAAEPVPEGVTVRPPCYIGPGAVLETGAVIGPYASIGAGSTVGTGASVSRSVIQGAGVGPGAVLEGTILCPGAVIREGAMLQEGSVIGERARVGANAVVGRQVRLWPERVVPDGCRQTESLTSDAVRTVLRFGDGGVIRGQAGLELTPDVGVALGMTAAAGQNAAALGFCGGNGARLMVQALACGVCAAGTRAVMTDVPCESAAAWAAAACGWDRMFFVRQEEGLLYLRILGPDGLPLPRSEERKIEGALLRGDRQPAAPERIGPLTAAYGAAARYRSEAARAGLVFSSAAHPCALAVRGEENSAGPLRTVLEHMGARVTAEQRGVPVFLIGHGGLRLQAVDEEDGLLGSEQLQVLLCLIEFERGVTEVALDETAPAAAERLAEAKGCRILRLGRDGAAAEALYREQSVLRDGVFAACRIYGRMAAAGERLRDLAERLPRFSVERREVPVSSSRAAVMHCLAQERFDGVSGDRGLRLRLGAGWVSILPMSRRSALRITAEGEDSEMAAELCAFFERKVRQTDERAKALAGKEKISDSP